MAANVFLQNGYMHNEHLLSLFLIKGRIYCLCFFFLSYVLDSLTKPLQQLLIIPSVFCYLCPSFLKNNRAFFINIDSCFEKRYS